MMKNIPDIDKIFKDGLDEHQEPVPAAVWEALNNDLDKKQAAHFKEKYFQMKRLAIVALLLIVFSACYMFYFSSAAKKGTVTGEQPISKNDPQQNTADNQSANKTSTGKSTKTGAEDAALTDKKTTAGSEVKENITATSKGTVAAGAENSRASTTSNNNKLSTTNDAAAKNTAQALITKTIISPATSQKLHGENLEQKTAVNNKSGAKSTYLHANDLPDNDQSATASHLYHIDGLKKDQSGVAGKTGSDKMYAHRNNNKNVALADTSITARTYPLYSLPDQPVYSSAEPAVIENPSSGLSTFIFTDSVQQHVQLETARAATAKKNAASIHRFSLEAFGAPNHSFKRLKNDEFLAAPGRDKKEAEHSEQQGSSFSAGLLVDYAVSKHISLQTGLVYTSSKTDIASKTVYARQDNNGHAKYELNCSSGYVYISPKTGSTPAIGDSMKVMGSSAHISYLGVPVSVSYVLKYGKFVFKPGAGLSLNFLTSNNSQTRFGNNPNWPREKETGEIAGLKKAYLDASAGLGIDYMISRRIGVGVRPLFRWALTSINKNTPVQVFQNFTSLEAGVKINL